MNDFESVVVEKLESIERRMSSMERQMTAIVNSYRSIAKRLTELESTCLSNHAGTPPPKGAQ